MTMIPKGCWGRGGIPPALRAQICADYKRLGTGQTARLHNRSRQTIQTIVKNSGVPRLHRPQRKAGSVCHQGEWFSPDHQGYLRSTSFASRKNGGLRMLHRVIWEAAHGPVPQGSIIIFADGNPRNCALENLECKTRSEWRRDPRSHAGNEWTVWRRKLGPLLAALDAANEALAGTDGLPAVTAAREAVESHIASAPRRAAAQLEKQKTFMLAKWASYTPEQRAARVAKTVKARWPAKQAELSTNP